LRVGLARHDEGGKPKPQWWCAEAWASRRICNERSHIIQRLAVDEPDVTVVSDQCAGGFGLASDIDRRPLPIEVGRAKHIVAHVKMLSLVGEPFTLHQARHHRDPFAAISIAFVMLSKADPGLLELGTVPGVDQIDRKAATADAFDSKRHLGQHDGMIEIRLDRRDDLDPARQCCDRGRGAPGFELVEILDMRVDGVLRDQCRIVAKLFRGKHEIAIAFPGSVVGLIGILVCAT
jgi:hypothetical protein